MYFYNFLRAAISIILPSKYTNKTTFGPKLMNKVLFSFYFALMGDISFMTDGGNVALKRLKQEFIL